MGQVSSPYGAIQDAIEATFITERNGGKLSGVLSVGNTWLNETSVYPTVYVDFDGLDEDLGDAVGQRKQQIHYIIGVSYRSNTSLADARKQIRSLIDDGNGNGICPILRDPSNFYWGQQILWSTITNLRIYDNGSDNATTTGQYIAYCVMRYNIALYL